AAVWVGITRSNPRQVTHRPPGIVEAARIPAGADFCAFRRRSAVAIDALVVAGVFAGPAPKAVPPRDSRQLLAVDSALVVGLQLEVVAEVDLSRAVLVVERVVLADGNLLVNLQCSGNVLGRKSRDFATPHMVEGPRRKFADMVLGDQRRRAQF